MKINFKELEDYLAQYGYPKSDLMKSDIFEIPEKTMYRYLKDNIKKYEDNIAMTYYGRKISYGELSENIDKTAAALHAVGLSKNDRVATLLPNIPEPAYIQYGPSKLGASASHIDPRTNGDTLLKFIEREKIKQIVVVDVMYESAIRPIEKELKEKYGIEQVIVVPAVNSLLLPLKVLMNIKNNNTKITSDILDIIYWDDLIRNSRYERVEEVPFEFNKEAITVHSSGSVNGIPKSISLSNENVNSFVEKHKPTIFSKLGAGDKMLHILPYFAAYGAINCVHLGFNFGVTLQEIPEFDFTDFGYLAAKNKSTILIGVPNWYSHIQEDTRLGKNSLRRIKMAIAGGDGTNEKEQESIDTGLRAHGCPVKMTKGHGMTELCGSGSYNFPGHENGIGVGTPFPYDKYIVLDENKNIVPLTKKGITGTIYVYSPSAIDGIFDGERIAETVWINNFRFLNTKDTMTIDGDYNLMFVEREDRAFTRFDGHKIKPADVENKILEHDKIKQCMVVPYTDEELMGKMPIAYVVPCNELSNEEKSNLVNDIANIILTSTELTSREVPKKVCFLEEIPHNKMSKNDFRALANRQLDGSEYTIKVIETNLKVEGYKVIEPNLKDKIKKMSI